ncbi:FAD-dependent monooxygenase [Taklimakanibacter lacteus]|uniref:FAD-dependent monooxygenase n=1 Tax=Taklimakanibacter lacteus TaxID=2268456 RepID=UPI000E663D87
MPAHPILIAGGGIAGIAGALGLARSGRECRVLEQANAFETVGAGLQIGPNAVRALKLLDAWDSIAPTSFAPSAIVIRDGRSGRILQEIRLGGEFERRFGEPYRVIHRADLLAGLIARATAHSGIEMVTGARVEQSADKGGYVEVTAGGRAMRGEALLGADGIRSAVRANLLGDSRPELHRHILYRALTPVEQPLPAKLSAVTLWLCRNGHVVHYPVRGGSALNVVAAVNGAWTDQGWSSPADRQEVMAHFTRVDQDLFQILAVSSPWLKWAAADRAPGAGWSRNRATLIGDAAHAALPYLAQGAAMALEDAVVLSRCTRQADSIATAFLAYERLRQPRTARIVRDSRRLGRLYHAGGALRVVRNALLRLSDPAGFLDRLAWIYDFDPAAA